MRCAAKSKQTGERCLNWRRGKSDYCYYHGGASLSGDALPQTKHGRYSKFLPDNLSSLAEKIGKDRELLDLSEEIENLDLRAAQILDGMEEEGEVVSTKVWSDLKRARKRLRQAEASGDMRKFREALFEIDDVVERGARLPDTWEELMRIWETRRRLVETEDRRRDRIAESVKVERIVLMFRQLAMSIKNNVLDPKISREKAVQNIMLDMQLFLGSTEEK